MKGKYLLADHVYRLGKPPHYRGDKNPSWKGGNIDIVCKQCGKQFSVKHNRPNAKYCSHLCRSNAFDEGKTPLSKRLRQSSRYSVWRKNVFERDSYTCQLCGQIGGYLNAHHIKPFSTFPELRFDILNGQTLCQKCHRKTDTFGAGMKKYLLYSGLEA